ncbi:hypothetical protein BN7_2872 [Wickerhamomyces ciferrii]|uniref:Uncharacterized protein n=1 Tax=Wickerhamomyces ciferrii (strain ATCC 14091 / BCRC 22168 / CBS 111 / JCM 3599 / NBRC 0793 / NRRL Y-1031 F-60-10) TaxID=1206466 RepID=K0KPM3_WICCF|nr:uncharacterized protein BN7_2872 [Wickerhamomyces ciferrii]CCH43324.1 hypothetical protein BN7_2872 [Wickerhamomyces ciferrii]
MINVHLKSAYEINHNDSARYYQFQAGYIPLFIVIGYISCLLMVLAGYWVYALVLSLILTAAFFDKFILTPKQIDTRLFKDKLYSIPPVHDKELMDRISKLPNYLKEVGNLPKDTKYKHKPLEGLGLFPMEIWEIIFHHCNYSPVDALMINKTFCECVAPKLYEKIHVLLTINSTFAYKDRTYKSFIRGTGYVTSPNERYEAYKEYQSVLKNDVEFIKLEFHKDFRIRGYLLNLITEVDIFELLIQNVLTNPNSYMKRFIKKINVDFAFMNLYHTGSREKNVELLSPKRCQNPKSCYKISGFQYRCQIKTIVSDQFLNGFQALNTISFLNRFSFQDYLIETSNIIPFLYRNYRNNFTDNDSARSQVSDWKNSEDAVRTFPGLRVTQPLVKYECYKYVDGYGYMYNRHDAISQYHQDWNSSFALQARTFKTLDETSTLINKTLDVLSSSNEVLRDVSTSTLFLDSFYDNYGAAREDIDGEFPSYLFSETCYAFRPMLTVFNKKPDHDKPIFLEQVRKFLKTT